MFTSSSFRIIENKWGKFWTTTEQLWFYSKVSTADQTWELSSSFVPSFQSASSQTLSQDEKKEVITVQVVSRESSAEVSVFHVWALCLRSDTCDFSIVFALCYTLASETRLSCTFSFVFHWQNIVLSIAWHSPTALLSLLHIVTVTVPKKRRQVIKRNDRNLQLHPAIIYMFKQGEVLTNST